MLLREVDPMDGAALPAPTLAGDLAENKPMAIRVTRARRGLALGGVAGNLSHAVEVLGGKLVGSHRLRRRAVSTLVTRLGWGVLPIVGVGLALWGVRAWSKRARSESELEAKSLPERDPKAPQDRVDESSWESFPASDPPALSPTKRAVHTSI